VDGGAAIAGAGASRIAAPPARLGPSAARGYRRSITVTAHVIRGDGRELAAVFADDLTTIERIDRALEALVPLAVAAQAKLSDEPPASGLPQ
jgi:hypothetical protein